MAGGLQKYKCQRDLGSMEERDMVKALELVSLESLPHTLCATMCLTWFSVISNN